MIRNWEVLLGLRIWIFLFSEYREIFALRIEIQKLVTIRIEIRVIEKSRNKKHHYQFSHRLGMTEKEINYQIDV